MDAFIKPFSNTLKQKKKTTNQKKPTKPNKKNPKEKKKSEKITPPKINFTYTNKINK